MVLAPLPAVNCSVVLVAPSPTVTLPAPLMPAIVPVLGPVTMNEPLFGNDRVIFEPVLLTFALAPVAPVAGCICSAERPLAIAVAVADPPAPAEAPLTPAPPFPPPDWAVTLNELSTELLPVAVAVALPPFPPEFPAPL